VRLGLEFSPVNQRAFGLVVSRYPSYARPATIVGVELILDVDLLALLGQWAAIQIRTSTPRISLTASITV
jgi:hypothetical protein